MRHVPVLALAFLVVTVQFLTGVGHDSDGRFSSVSVVDYDYNDSDFPEAIQPFCLNRSPSTFQAHPEYPIHIAIDIDKARSWSRNRFEAWLGLGTFGGITDTYKRNYDATIHFTYADGRSCTDRATVRLHGDGYDHLRTTGPLQSSLDVTLESGHLAGLVHFKLLLPETRNGDNEIFATTLFETLGFLTPRTFYISATVNGDPVRYIAQEKFRSELLTYRNISDLPILQVDERFGYPWTEHTDSPDVVNNPHYFTTLRLSNPQFARNGPVSRRIVEEAIGQLNQVYAQVASFKEGASRVDQLPGVEPVTGSRVSRLVTSSSLPILRNSYWAHLSDASRFSALFLALGSSNVHGLKSHNQRFIYDPWMRTVQPIYYDGQVAVISSGLQPTMRAKDWLKGIIGFVRDDHDPSLDTSDLQATPATAQAAKQLRRDLAQIDTNAMALTLSERGAKISRGTLNDLIGVDGVVDNNLQAIISSPTLGDTDYIPSDYFAPFRDPSIRLVFSSDDLAGWSSCSLQGTDCTDLFLSDEEHVQLLRGRLTLAGIDYIYVGPSITSYRDGLLQDGFRNGSWSRQNLSNGVDLWTNSAVETTIDRETKTLTLKATEAEAKAVLSKGTLTDWSVVFSGVRQIDNNQTQELGQVSERYDDRGLTGCLTFRDIRLSHLSIEADGGNCEDSVHFIRAKGHVTSIAIKYAFQDALDMDFSDLEVSNTSITFSGNDCIDTSKGDYIFTQATLTRCSDKAVSLGESSIAHLHRLTVTSAPVAIASKDSSFGSIEHGYLSDVGICATTYRKKQAYSGGGLRLGTVTCDAQEYRQQPGSELAILGP